MKTHHEWLAYALDKHHTLMSNIYLLSFLNTQMSNVLRCFTDGASKGNSETASAGWAYYIPKLNIRESGHIVGTCNKAELTAIFQLLSYILSNPQRFIEFNELLIFSDSEYSIGVLTGYRITANKELITSIIDLGNKLRQTYVDIKFKHVDAHTGGDDWISKCNDVVDQLASSAARLTSMRSNISGKDDLKGTSTKSENGTRTTKSKPKSETKTSTTKTTGKTAGKTHEKDKHESKVSSKSKPKSK